MTDENCVLSGKGGIAEHVIRMSMGIYHVADRLRCNGANCCEQPLPLAYAAARIDDRNGIIPDYEADICDPAFVLGGHQGVHAVVNKYPGGNFSNFKCRA